GGNTKTNYIANINISQRQGILKRSNFDSFQGRAEINHRLFDDKVKLKFGILGKKTEASNTGSGGYDGYIFSQATRRNPTEPVKNEDGSWYENTSKFEYENPVSKIYEVDGNRKRTTLRMNGSITYNPIRDLTLQA
ncbi:hypothetical protein RCJ22_24410, partial [Vibrio sp. FNV 38]|nr:hypothetical protein [Vibrio sp. FNV 38]